MKRWLLLPLVLGLFGLAFFESWAALVQAAEAATIPYPIPWPFMVDGFIVAAALLVVEARRTGHTWGAWWPRLGLLAATALSTTIQVAYAPVDNWARALHGWSPLAVLASFECLVWLVFSQGSREAASTTLPLPMRVKAWARSWEQADEPDGLAEINRLKAQVNNARTSAAFWATEPNDLSLEDWQAVLAEHQYRCTYCDAADQRLTIEHRVPTSRGGPNTKSNVVPACRPCNTSKGAKTEEEFRAWQAAQPSPQVTADLTSQLSVQRAEQVAQRAAARAAASSQPALQRGTLAPSQERRIRAYAEQGRSALWITQKMGLSDRARTDKVGPIVRQIRAEMSQVVSQNGGRSHDAG